MKMRMEGGDHFIGTGRVASEALFEELCHPARLHGGREDSPGIDLALARDVDAEGKLYVDIPDDNYIKTHPNVKFVPVVGFPLPTEGLGVCVDEDRSICGMYYLGEGGPRPIHEDPAVMEVYELDILAGKEVGQYFYLILEKLDGDMRRKFGPDQGFANIKEIAGKLKGDTIISGTPFSKQ